MRTKYTESYRDKNIGKSAQKEIFEVEHLNIGESLACNDDANTEA